MCGKLFFERHEIDDVYVYVCYLTSCLGCEEALKDKSFSNVVFCVPPSKNEDYVAELQGAVKLWSGEGSFVFTSSGMYIYTYDDRLASY